ncbi:MAG TPA: M56 family metallopeptidase [Candidatus Binatia bacterium]|jgi:beta-lactamase regulating signal transducer with metallopeptidase domain|nr:M56 family metallopeptidase [Candidatus Binatia bacterium]
MQDLIEYPVRSLLKASWQGAVLILLVLAIQWAFRGRLHPRWRYALWLLVLVRLALPWTVASPTSLFNLLKLSMPPVLAGVRAAPNDSGSQTAQPTTAVQIETAGKSLALRPPIWGRTSASRLSVCVGVWALGVLGLASCLVVTHFRLARRISRQRAVTDAAMLELLEDCKQQMGVRVPVTLVETREVGSPSLFGFMRPRLLLPAGLTRTFSLAELRCVFLHELGHVKRHDILVGWLMTGLQLLHWFNPLVWLAFYRMRVDRELACDALALTHAREEEQQRYGHTIIKLLESFGRPAWAPSLAGAVENKDQLKERIKMIANFKQTNRGPALAVALAAGLGLITLTDAQPATSQLGKELIGTWIMVGQPGQVGEPPAVGGRIKLVTDQSWSVTQTDPKTGAVIFHHGGTYALKANEYLETVDYANDSTREMVKKTFKFNIKIEGDTLTLIGIGNPWTEVWKRVKSDSPKPTKAEPTSLQGTWHGREEGVAGISSLTVRGSSLEFHSADSNEWYKAAISVYDTTPKQLVVAITDCPVRQYVGVTAYAIFQLQDGTLTITGNEPGTPVAPAGFDAPGARKLVFKQE